MAGGYAYPTNRARANAGQKNAKSMATLAKKPLGIRESEQKAVACDIMPV